MSGGGSVTQQTNPPAYAMPYLQGGLSEAQKLYNQGPQTSDQTQAARDMITNRATNGDPTITAAQNYAQKSLNGDFLNANPYLDATFNQAALATQNQLASQFAGSGRNIGASENNRSQQLNNLATSIYGGNYANERQLQNSAMGSAQSLGNQSYVDAQALAGVGSQIDNQQGTLLDQYLGRINQAAPGSSTTSKTSTSGLADAAGGGLLLSQLFGSGSGGTGVLNGVGGSALSGIKGLFGAGAGGLSSDAALAASLAPAGGEAAALGAAGYAGAGSGAAGAGAASGGASAATGGAGFLGGLANAGMIGATIAPFLTDFGEKNYSLDGNGLSSTDAAGRWKAGTVDGGSGTSFGFSSNSGGNLNNTKWTNPNGQVIDSGPVFRGIAKTEANAKQVYAALQQKGAVGLPPFPQFWQEFQTFSNSLVKK